jgi:TolA-binding protein
LAWAKSYGDQAPDVTASDATAPRAAAPGLAPPPHLMTPAALFAESLSDRQQGRVEDAIAGFRALTRQFPDAAEAKVALVSLGDLLLGAGRAADALTAYEGYLARAPAETLVPESLWGKVRALELLGRTREAEATRREIARRFPDFPYARPGVGAGGSSP